MTSTAEAYAAFLESRSRWYNDDGLTGELVLPRFLYDYQRYLVEWALRKGRAAIFADCGLGKTAIQLAWADEIVRRTNRHVVIATPLAVCTQTLGEAERFGVAAVRSRHGDMPSGSPQVVVTNYEQLHKFDVTLLGGFVGDESSCIKDAKSARKALVVEFARKMKYRLLCTATAAPNDYHELGTSSEALGYLGYRDMLTMFFKAQEKGGQFGWSRTKWRFRGHAENQFWSWVCSWARSLMKPSDVGFSDERFILPELIERDVIVNASGVRSGRLFPTPATDLRGERAERNGTIEQRCGLALDNVTSHDGHSVIWCETNSESEWLAKNVPDSVEVTGSMSDDAKEEALEAFTSGRVKRLVTKPKIGAWGLNWQHCHNVVSLPSHSYEQYYQAVRRCWRYGQKIPVTVTRIICEGERGILDSLKRKSIQSQEMFGRLVKHMQDRLHIVSEETFPFAQEMPKWL